ncbi:E3 SUMO-protein ligase PIAS2-like [Drosophila guanche]|uniref:Blast:E3 SUMO-protein ligase PIAS1 n=1 Tax=Drosophila guanche TaxID=7266 RepID=A0A3B0JRA1_DROGU|nr:E3 SUMO-protein ligase PIAS2-like [Drosophila guanche]SPP77980.1 blast:E3 SUMO-protein ligase PIAS1 [Drosophila guanche]
MTNQGGVTFGFISDQHPIINDMVNSIKKMVAAHSVQKCFLVNNTFAARPDVPNIMVSLNCPVNERKIKVPCRGLACTHFLCFDAAAYLVKSLCENRWTCPLCHKWTPFHELCIDGYFLHVLQSGLLEQLDFEIKVHRNGAWSVPGREYQSISYISA